VAVAEVVATSSAMQTAALNARTLPGLTVRITAEPMKRPTIAPPQ